ncbi:lysophospholipid acyltransferase family protein [Microbulbifer thermotolerans]|uniref:lysophospholipid acyltransferase family protein n=1 Tax=Microbulbifer thermotolerans TaxID=252514 RepID=UPI00224B8FA6|nr:GNAT family N-acyltransferase [Microbulbifer thermotolerans]MCX2834194.1 lysophospholipid acyltransferase family protein [Microbulbifer thermotolerans]
MIQLENLLQQNSWYSAAPSRPTRRLVSATLKKICCEERIQAFGRRYAHLGGLDFIRQVFADFDFRYDLNPLELERVPRSGPLVIVSNHPLGSLDGLALIDMVARVRKDVRAIASQLLWNIEPLRPYLLPVDNFNGRTRRGDVDAIYRHLQQGGVIIVFPSGEVSRLTPQGVRDGRWNPGFVRFAEKTGAPILPVQVRGRNSWWFYGLSMVNKPLSTLWLVREMFKQAKRSIDIRIGTPVEAAHFCEWPMAPRAQAALWRRHVYKLHKSPRPLGPEPIAAAEPVEEVVRVMENCDTLVEQGAFSVKLYRQQVDCPVMRELSRIREIAFRAVGEGTGQSRDWDVFDAHYDHLLLWDGERQQIAGAYRLAKTDDLEPEQIYSSTLFNYPRPPRQCLPGSAELGRSFLLPEYWRTRGLDLLWCGIGQWIARNQVRYLFGPVSMPGTFSARAKSAIVRYFLHHFATSSPLGDARLPFAEARGDLPELSGDAGADMAQLKQILKEEGAVLPPLFKKYTAVTRPGGTSFHAFNVDPDFCDSVDGLVVVDLEQVDPKFAKRYLGG